MNSTYFFGELTLHPPEGSRLDLLCSEMRCEFPRLTMQRKSDHWYWRWVAAFLRVITLGKQGAFLTRFTTTVGMHLAFGSNELEDVTKMPVGWDARLWATLLHERRHLRRFKRLGVLLVTLIYVFGPLPVGLAWGRAWFEREGYLETLRAWFVTNPAWAKSAEAREWWVKQFIGPNYLWAWPFRRHVEGWFDAELIRLQLGGDVWR